MMLQDEKAALRKAIRARYPGADQRTLESDALCRHVLASDIYRQAKCIAGYLPLRREADVTPILRDALAAGKQLLLPRVEGEGSMTLRCIDDLDSLTIGSFGILEPAADTAIVSPAAAELILIPLEGIDPTGMRLGKGGGYYDRLLQDYRGCTLGVVMSWQWTERVPFADWDQPLHAAADCRGITWFER